MTSDFVPCGKCGKPTSAPQFYVPPVTWEGKLVCAACSRELQRAQRERVHQPHHQQ